MTGRNKAHPRALTLFTIAAFGGLSACAGTDPVVPGRAVEMVTPGYNQEAYVGEQGDGYILRPADKVSLIVFREEALSLPEVTVSATGDISVPLVGPVQVSGMTVRQLEEHLEQALGARYLRDPDVVVNVVAYGSHVVTVEGSVEAPGMYAFRPGTRLSGGIALAEGPTRVAAVDQIAIFRQVDGHMEVAKFDYAAVRAGTMLDPVLLPDDRIVVGTDGLSQFWQDFLKAAPVFALFTRI